MVITKPPTNILPSQQQYEHAHQLQQQQQNITTIHGRQILQTQTQSKTSEQPTMYQHAQHNVNIQQYYQLTQ